MSRRFVAVITTCWLLATAGSTAHADVAGSPGLGDPFFPDAGNGGYDVSHYDLSLRYVRPTGTIRARTVISATATETLGRFDLDLRRLQVRSVSVDGEAATFQRQGQELVITPEHELLAGTGFGVSVRYAGRPRPVRDPDGTPDGWMATGDGAVAMSEPQGSPSWFPCNDYPTDKASYDVRLTVPRGLRAVANGHLVDVQREGRLRTFSWQESQPMASYLATVAIGRFDVTRRRYGAIRDYVAVDRSQPAEPTLARLIPKMLSFFASRFGPYPFADTGAIIVAPIPYALETQTRPVLRAGNDTTLAHELAHQWFGDSVSLERWPDMWLNEGFATFAEWLWEAHSGGTSIESRFRADYKTEPSDRIWAFPPASIPSPKDLFATPVYERGAMTLVKLRDRIGAAAFYRLLRRWARKHRYGNADTGEFESLASQVSGQDLAHFFDVWLRQPGKPAPGSW